MSAPNIQDAIAGFQADPNFRNPMSAPVPAQAYTPGVPAGIPAMGVPVPPPAPVAPASIPAMQPGPGPAPVPIPRMPAPVPAPSGQPRAARPASTPIDPLDQLDRDAAVAAHGEQAALAQKADTVQQGATDEGQALADLRVQRQADAAELAEKAQQNQEINAKLDADDERNLEQAKNKTIPDFWAGHEGKLVGATIAVALSRFGAALLGQSGNNALTSIQHNIDQYYSREKDKIDNLYRFAQAKGKLNDDMRHRYAAQLLDLKDQHTYGIEAARDRIAQVAAQSKGSADVAQIKVLQAQLDKQIVQDRLQTRQLRAELELKKYQGQAARASAAASYANAAESRAGAKLKLAQADQEGKGLPKTISGEMLKSQGFADTAKANDQIITNTPISPAGIRTILQDMANEQLWEKNPSAKAVAMSTGMYKTLEQKLSPQDQRALVAARQFINADLRRESGAAIGAQEFQSAFARYFPAVGDSAATIRQKQFNRQQSIHSMEVAGGTTRAGQPVQEQGRQYSTQDNAVFEWALANPGDPRSKQVREHQGR